MLNVLIGKLFDPKPRGEPDSIHVSHQRGLLPRRRRVASDLDRLTTQAHRSRRELVLSPHWLTAQTRFFP
ncbi:hypothetical protein BC939DRAFT_447673 [Gamsiella multidivaricata]|uniref:uncharacterized protein n=1 Tax=Gamsiella multidivaricata TaxID=101098 RepID=UPI0022200121|nr:uncharacterized protein BC939DRAFT_447673 [Gamsiella multidivaricata]KAI7826059.1 hypothetical protein BC939DRAFT_447673 [Gamsiella multidivaricata]